MYICEIIALWLGVLTTVFNLVREKIMNIEIVVRRAVKILEAEAKYPVTKMVLLESISGLMDSEDGDFNEIDLVMFYRSQYTVLDFLGKLS
jgi:hypothetical protein